MMEKIGEILGGGIMGFAKGVADIVDKFIETPDEKRQATEKIMELATKEQMAVIAATHTVIQAEAQSPDPWVRRARPTFLWLMYAILGFNFLVVPLMAQVGGFLLTTPPRLEPIQLPEPLFWLFGSGYLGYAGARTWDKWIQRKI